MDRDDSHNSVSPIVELEDLVATFPDRHDLRRELIEHLLVAEDTTAALSHLHIICASNPANNWAARLGLALAQAVGHSDDKSRFARHIDDELLSDPNVVAGRVVPHPKHPASTSETLSRRLRLVLGGSGETVEPSIPVGNLDDMTGMKTVRRNLRALIDQISAEQHATIAPKAWLGGLFLFGPAHCGKSFAAELIAGELNAALWSFDLSHHWKPTALEQSISDAIESSVTDGIGVLHFANLDARDARAHLGPMLDDLDSAQTRTRIVIITSATEPWLVAPEFLDSRRARRSLLVLPPDAPPRRSCLTEAFRGRGTISTDDVEWLTARTDGFTFHELRQLVDYAVAAAKRDTNHAFMVPPIRHAIVREARQSVTMSCTEWLTKATHHAMVSPDTGLYDDLISYLSARDVTGDK